MCACKSSVMVLTFSGVARTFAAAPACTKPSCAAHSTALSIMHNTRYYNRNECFHARWPLTQQHRSWCLYRLWPDAVPHRMKHSFALALSRLYRRSLRDNIHVFVATSVV